MDGTPPRPAECRLRVLRALGAGQTQKEVAASLNISLHTVIGYLREMRHDSGTRTTVELMHLATRLRWIE